MAEPVGFEQHPEYPPGTGTFTFSDGRSILARDPNLAAYLLGGAGQKTPPPPANPIAAAGYANAHAPPQTQFDQLAALKQPPPAPEAPPTGMQRIPLPAAGGQSAGGAPPGPPLVHSAGSPGGFVPGTRSVTTEAGPEYSMEDAADRAAANRAVVQAQLADFAAQKTEAENAAIAAQSRQVELADQLRKQQREVALKQQNFEIERAKAQSLVQSAEQRKIDPNQLYKEKGMAASVGLVIMQGLGAFASAITHTDNWAANMVNQSIDRNIAAQEDEIRTGRAGANNALARINQQFGGDLEMAKSVLKETQLAAVDAQIKEHAAWSNSAATSRAAALWLAQNQQARLLEEQKQQAISFGKTTIKQDSKYQAPQAGGTREMTPAEQAKYWENQAKIKKFRDQATGNALDEADSKAVERYGKLRQGPENMLGQVSDVVALAGGKVENGRVHLPSDVPGVGVVASRLPDALISDQGSRVRQTLGNLAADVIKDKSGAAVTDSERALLMKIMQGGVKTATELQQGLQIIHNYADRKRKNVEASFPAPVRETYRRQGRESNREEYGNQGDTSDIGEL